MEEGRRGDEEIIEPGERRTPLRQALAENAEPLRRFLFRLSGDAERAQDLSQETMVRALVSFRRYRGQAAFRTWLFAIAANLYRDETRRRRPLVPVETESLDDGGESARRVERGLDAERAWRLLLGLPEAKRKALVLRLEFGHSYEEIAAILGCPIGTVRSRIHTGLEELRLAMGEGYGR